MKLKANTHASCYKEMLFSVTNLRNSSHIAGLLLNSHFCRVQKKKSAKVDDPTRGAVLKLQWFRNFKIMSGSK